MSKVEMGDLVIVVGDEDNAPSECDLEMLHDAVDRIRTSTRGEILVLSAGAFPLQVIGARDDDGLLRFAGRKLRVEVVE